MALIFCPECGEQISEKAVKCIHCGTVLKEEPKFEKSVWNVGKYSVIQIQYALTVAVL